MTLEVMPFSSAPYRLAVVALLGWSPVVMGQAPVARVEREQLLVLSERPARAELEVRVALGVTTLVRVDAELVEVKREGLGEAVWVDVAANSLQVELRRALAPGERLPLELLLEEGGVRTRVELLLVSHPSEVDTRVSVQLRPRLPRTAMAPERTRPPQGHESFARFVHSGLMGEEGVTNSNFQGVANGKEVRAEAVRDYRTAGGRVLAIQVFNPEGGRPWLASEAVRISPMGAVLPGSKPWAVYMEGPIAPGSRGLMVVPLDEADAPVLLDVREHGGSRDVRVTEER
ncbi:MAG TPA: DUF2381 family protein [Myxococcaceae bacterium]|nr:DUF2381 family protein [Myxococcaceae bacterium]